MELNWDNARTWQEQANSEKEEYGEPKWKWDCGFKLDFDGSLLRISSRFYPPHKNSSNRWEGDVTVMFLHKEILKKEFKCDSLDQLRLEVEKFTEEYSNGIEKVLVINN